MLYGGIIGGRGKGRCPGSDVPVPVMILFFFFRLQMLFSVTRISR